MRGTEDITDEDEEETLREVFGPSRERLTNQGAMSDYVASLDEGGLAFEEVNMQQETTVTREQVQIKFAELRAANLAHDQAQRAYLTETEPVNVGPLYKAFKEAEQHLAGIHAWFDEHAGGCSFCRSLGTYWTHEPVVVEMLAMEE